MAESPNFIKKAAAYATRRKLLYKSARKKDCNPETLRQEVLVARLLGEMAAGERILNAIRDNSDWDVSTIEGELHLFISAVNNEVAKIMDSSRTLDVEDVMKAYGYYDEKNKNNKKGE